MVAEHGSRVSRLVAILALASGCFYTDPINQRPSLSIRQDSGAQVYRKDVVELEAVVNDPEGRDVSLAWHAAMCTDTTPDASGNRSGCDPALFSSTDAVFSFTVSSFRADHTTPVSNVYVTLQGTDSLGAAAKPIQELVISIADQAPDLALSKDSRYAYVVGTAIDLFAKIGDADDGPEAVGAPTWQVVSPANQPAYTLDDLAVMQDPNDLAHLQYGKTFTPMGIGDWEIDVTATDPYEIATNTPGITKPLSITVVADHAPCLEEWAPITPVVATDALPLSDPTLFQVLVVQDDLDPFPSVPGDPVLGETTFSWSILPPGAATRQSLAGVSGNAVELDPASYTPGDLVELRVEIQDRNHTPVNCPDGDLTCSTISDASCIQRLTWRLEVQ